MWREFLGVGCAGSNGVPILKVSNGTAPVLGTQLGFAYLNGPTSPLFLPIISTGFDNPLFNGIPLPLPVGASGCRAACSTTARS